MKWPGAQGQSEISPGTADVQGDPERKDGRNKRTMASHPPLTEAAPFSKLVGFSPFPLFVQENPGLDTTRRMKTTSGMSLCVCSLLSQRCRLFNNHLMTVIKNVSGF